MVFQNYALYPHMTVRDNLGFSLRVRRMPKAERAERVAAAADMLGLADLLDRRPAQLSGGQRQRVAMGRAIVRQPTAFLMDEPLSNLDAKLRVSMRSELTNLHARLGVTTVYVTHDQVEAMTLGQRVAVIEDGLVQQVAHPQELFRAPANLFVATFIGSPAMNVAPATVVEKTLRFGQFSVPLDDRQGRRLQGRQQVVVGLRPESFTLAVPGADTPTLAVDVAGIEVLGTETHVFFGVDEAPVLAAQREARDDDSPLAPVAGQARFVARLHADVRPRIGDQLELAVDTDTLHFFDVESGLTLTG
jgi:multiple sugar transport system ATP-binding protein